MVILKQRVHTGRSFSLFETAYVIQIDLEISIDYRGAA